MLLLLLLLLLLLAFLDMKNTHVTSRATSVVVPSQAAGRDGAFFCHVSRTTPVSKSTLVSFVAMLGGTRVLESDYVLGSERTCSKLWFEE